MRYEGKTEQEAVDGGGAALGKPAGGAAVHGDPRREVVLGRPGRRDRGRRARRRAARRRAAERSPSRPMARPPTRRPSGREPAAAPASARAATARRRRGRRRVAARRVDADGAALGGRAPRRDPPARLRRRRDALRADRRRRRAAARQPGRGADGPRGPGGRIASKRLGQPVHPRLDAEGFRAHRKGALEELAAQSAAEVRRTRRPQLLPPLSPWERRLVHLALAEDPEVETESEGDGFLKRVEVRPQESASGHRPMRPADALLDTIVAPATPAGRSALAARPPLRAATPRASWRPSRRGFRRRSRRGGRISLRSCDAGGRGDRHARS